jgi:uncharacterized protein (DUF169 family)
LEPKELAERIERYLRPDTYPLAVRTLVPAEEVPPKAKRPLRDLGIRVSICQGISMSRVYGWTVAMGGEDLSCPIAEVAFGHRPAIRYYQEGTLAQGMYAATPAAAAATEAAVPKAEGPTVVLVAPLRNASFEPEAAILYGNAAQVMVAVAAALFEVGGTITSEFNGRADCAEIVNRTIATGRPQVILPCYGDRVFGQTQDHEMAFTLPWSWAEAFARGLEGTWAGGVRYPIPRYLRYEAEFPATYRRLQELWAEGDGDG